jgi:hypothetical protein
MPQINTLPSVTQSGPTSLGTNDAIALQSAADGVTRQVPVSVLTSGIATTQIVLGWLPPSPSYLNDAAAAVGGVVVGQLYRNGSLVMVRVA